MDKLKQHIGDHLNEMDSDIPSADLWNRIEPSIPSKSNVRVMALRYVAAASIVFLLVLTGRYFMQENQEGLAIHQPGALRSANLVSVTDTSTIVNPTEDTTVTVQPQIVKKVKADKDVRYAMMHSFRENYTQLVNYQLKTIRTTPIYAEDPAYFDEFKQTLKGLDANEKTIRQLIRQEGITNLLLEKLISVYQQKLDVLKTLQGEINKMNERVKDANAMDTVRSFFLHV